MDKNIKVAQKINKMDKKWIKSMVFKNAFFPRECS